MNPVTIIQDKRDGKELSSGEINAFVRGVIQGDFADYQTSAFLMATFFQGMTTPETVALTQAMLESGERYDLSHIKGAKVDKHSTGGVGDKVSLILAPLAAACGLKVPMMAGRGLGHTGGTLDKLESISGFDVRPPFARFDAILQEVGCAIIGQSDRIAPADKKLYSLRDVTATVDCIPLIVSSILSKKLAAGTDALVLDIKVGSGAFMKSKEQARKLARALILVAGKLGLKCRAMLTSMDQPLGYSVGNSLELIESIEILRGTAVSRGRTAAGPDASSSDLKELTIQLCAQMLDLGRLVPHVSQGSKLAHARLSDGSAWKIFERMVDAQGGKTEQIKDPTLLPKAEKTWVWNAPKRGFITSMNTESLGQILVDLGGGRKKASDSVDPSVGLIFHKKLGAKVASGEGIVTVHGQRKTDFERLSLELSSAIQISAARKAVPKLILETLS